MNERIDELMIQAGARFEFLHGVHYDDFQYRKFAELIVRECVGIVDKIVPPGYADYPDYRDQIEKSFRRECAIEIKKHFGIR